MNKILKYIIYMAISVHHYTVLAQKTCLTPNQKTGQCVLYNECHSLVQLYEQYGGNFPEDIRNYFAKSVCTGNTNGVHICCANDDTTFTNSLPTKGPPTSQTGSSDNVDITKSKGFEILDKLQCGDSTVKKLAFGEEAQVAEYPFMALLRYNVPQQPFLCGGTLITNRFVLTAAHCIIGARKLVGVRLGEHTISKKEDCRIKGPARICAPPVEDYGIAQQIPHSEYNEGLILNDIALIKLDRNVIFKVHIQPICLPITAIAQQKQLEEYFTTGWGTTQNESSSDVLMRGKVQHRDSQVCKDTFRDALSSVDQYICAGGLAITDTCKGDSGGPLFFFAKYKAVPRYVQYGIVSFGANVCGIAKPYPGIYTDVIKFLPWITQNIN